MRGGDVGAIRLIVNDAVAALEGEFAALYSPIGPPLIAPEKLLRAILLQAFYSIRLERLLVKRLEYDLLFRWFVGIGDAASNHLVLSKSRDRLLKGSIGAKLLSAILSQPKVKRLLSTEHFCVDSTLIREPSRRHRFESDGERASMKSVKPKDGSGAPLTGGGERNAEADFHVRSAPTQRHASTTDPDARLYRKGKETKLCFMGHGLDGEPPWLAGRCLTEANGPYDRPRAGCHRHRKSSGWAPLHA